MRRMQEPGRRSATSRACASHPRTRCWTRPGGASRGWSGLVTAARAASRPVLLRTFTAVFCSKYKALRLTKNRHLRFLVGGFPLPPNAASVSDMDEILRIGLAFIGREWGLIEQAPLLLGLAWVCGAALSWIALHAKYEATISRLKTHLQVQEKELYWFRANQPAPAALPRDKHGLYHGGKQIGQVSTRPKVDSSGKIIIFAAATSAIDLESANPIEFRDYYLQVDGYDSQRPVNMVGQDHRIGYERLRCRIIGAAR